MQSAGKNTVNVSIENKILMLFNAALVKENWCLILVITLVKLACMKILLFTQNKPDTGYMPNVSLIQ